MYAVEPWPSFVKEFEQMWVSEHRAEVQGPQSDAMINTSLYADYHEMKQLIVCTARFGKHLVGYVVAMVIEDVPFMGNVTGDIAFYYVSKDYRGRGVGYKLFDIIGELLRVQGVDNVYASAKTNLPFADSLRRYGYEDCELTLRKRL
jgi:ribosomal protein S18 acetylase RimI-like enzyme